MEPRGRIKQMHLRDTGRRRETVRKSEAFHVAVMLSMNRKTIPPVSIP